MHMPVPCQPGLSKIRSEDMEVASAEAERRRREREVDDELAQSFPASDPPSWTMGVAPADSDTRDGPESGVAAGAAPRRTHALSPGPGPGQPGRT